ncbi:Asp23/Gls24 family envelope stress response protein [uncultured Megasphaera sp.]|uniref:Asp23/Gls24 family envelope stress response protein n=1 Tax=uncultured Megasphaera sp. TaxID=165188 RepID=UPI0025FD68BC|nr:Asp23/Gls24 family envelope stress response protein [uncultured Megasphaera sp.]
MEIYGFIGASGTGKSHHALVVAYDHDIQCIIDDGLLIDHNRIIAGRSAKEETNRLKAVRRAIFNKPEDAAAMRATLAKVKPEKLLILGTSKHMIHRICESLQLPEASQFIRIEDVSDPQEIAKARAIRLKEGKHIIPVPTMELKPHFQGYLLDPIRSFFYGRNGKKLSAFERSVVRPVFSYYGKLIFSDEVLEALVRHALGKNEGVTKINRLRVAINYNSTRNGLAIILSLTVAYGENIKTLMSRIRRDIQDEVEYTTGMCVEILKITVSGISAPQS